MANPSPGFRRHPEHTITVEPYPRSVAVHFGDTLIASSNRALELREKDYPPVLYVPFEDVLFEHLERTPTRTHCPFKGEASYWAVSVQTGMASDVMWAYETPYDEMLAIKDHAAFYPTKVTIET